jgi:flagellar motor protein MotB
MAVIESRRVFLEEEEGSAPWLVTFSDLIFLMLTFFVLQFSMSSPVEPSYQVEGEPLPPLKVSGGGESTVISGAFNPSDSPALSFRGKTALEALGKQAAELGQDVVISLEPVTISEDYSDRESVKESLFRQREAVMRQLVDSGLSPAAILLEPIDTSPIEKKNERRLSKSLSSRLTLTLQRKRS